MGCCDARRDQMDLHPTVVSQEVLIVQGDVVQNATHMEYTFLRTRGQVKY